MMISKEVFEFIDSEKDIDIHKNALKLIVRSLEVKETSYMDVVQIVEKPLVGSDDKQRFRATLLLAELLDHSGILLDGNTLAHMTKFFTSRLADYPSIVPSLQGIQTILQKHIKLIESSISQELNDILHAIFEKLYVPSLVQTIRFRIFTLFETILKLKSLLLSYPDYEITSIVKNFLTSMEGEKDPRCLLTVLKLIQKVYEVFPSAVIQQIAEDIFDNTSCYFPITFTPPEDDPFGITTESLVDALKLSFCSHNELLKYVVPFLIDQIASSDVTNTGKNHAFDYIGYIASLHGPNVLEHHLNYLSEILLPIAISSNSAPLANPTSSDSSTTSAVYAQRTIADIFKSIHRCNSPQEIYNYSKLFIIPILSQITKHIKQNNPSSPSSSRHSSSFTNILVINSFQLIAMVGSKCYISGYVMVSHVLPLVLGPLRNLRSATVTALRTIYDGSIAGPSHNESLEPELNGTLLKLILTLISWIDPAVDYSGMCTSSSMSTGDEQISETQRETLVQSPQVLLQPLFLPLLSFLYLQPLDANDGSLSMEDEHSHSHDHSHDDDSQHQGCGDHSGGGCCGNHQHSHDHDHVNDPPPPPLLEDQKTGATRLIALERSTNQVLNGVIECMKEVLLRYPPGALTRDLQSGHLISLSALITDIVLYGVYGVPSFTTTSSPPPYSPDSHIIALESSKPDTETNFELFRTSVVRLLVSLYKREQSQEGDSHSQQQQQQQQHDSPAALISLECIPKLLEAMRLCAQDSNMCDTTIKIFERSSSALVQCATCHTAPVVNEIEDSDSLIQNQKLGDMELTTPTVSRETLLDTLLLSFLKIVVSTPTQTLEPYRNIILSSFHRLSDLLKAPQSDLPGLPVAVSSGVVTLLRSDPEHPSLRSPLLQLLDFCFSQIPLSSETFFLQLEQSLTSVIQQVFKVLNAKAQNNLITEILEFLFADSTTQTYNTSRNTKFKSRILFATLLYADKDCTLFQSSIVVDPAGLQTPIKFSLESISSIQEGLDSDVIVKLLGLFVNKLTRGEQLNAILSQSLQLVLRGGDSTDDDYQRKWRMSVLVWTYRALLVRPDVQALSLELSQEHEENKTVSYSWFEIFTKLFTYYVSGSAVSLLSTPPLVSMLGLLPVFQSDQPVLGSLGLSLANQSDVLVADFTPLLDKIGRFRVSALWKQKLWNSLVLPLLQILSSGSAGGARENIILTVCAIAIHVPQTLLASQAADIALVVAEALNASKQDKSLQDSPTSSSSGKSSVEVLIQKSVEMLEVLLGMNREAVTPYISTISAGLCKAAMYGSFAKTRAAAVRCLSLLKYLPYHQIHPYRKSIEKSLAVASDDKKRLVRLVASRVRNEWISLASQC